MPVGTMHTRTHAQRGASDTFLLAVTSHLRTHANNRAQGAGGRRGASTAAKRQRPYAVPTSGWKASTCTTPPLTASAMHLRCAPWASSTRSTRTERPSAQPARYASLEQACARLGMVQRGHVHSLPGTHPPSLLFYLKILRNLSEPTVSVFLMWWLRSTSQVSSPILVHMPNTIGNAFLWKYLLMEVPLYGSTLL